MTGSAQTLADMVYRLRGSAAAVSLVGYFAFIFGLVSLIDVWLSREPLVSAPVAALVLIAGVPLMLIGGHLHKGAFLAHATRLGVDAEEAKLIWDTTEEPDE